jgi:hypothetical protein
MRGRPFPPGVSGNPAGRPKIAAEVHELARQHVPAAIKELARLALKARSEAVRVAAARELLDRAYGKAIQTVEGSLQQGSVPNELPLVQFIFSDDGSRPPT